MLFSFPYYLADGLIDALVDSPWTVNRGLCAWTAHQSVQEEASISSAGILIRVFYGSGQGDAGWHSFGYFSFAIERKVTRPPGQAPAPKRAY